MIKKDIKRKIFFFQLYELESVKKFLESMASQGWMLVSKKGICFYFKKCNPKDVVFSVEVFDKASMFDVYQNSENLEYIEYCKAAGWKFVCADGKVQIFYSENKDIVPIETDMVRKFKTLNKTMWITNFIFWLVLPVINVWDFLLIFSMGIVALLSSYLMFSTVLLNFTVICLLVFNLAKYLVWFITAKRRLARTGEFQYSDRRATVIVLRFILFIMVFWIISVCVNEIYKAEGTGWIVILALGVIALTLIGSCLINFIMRKIGAPAKYNRIGAIAGSVVFAIISVGLVTTVMFSIIFSDVFSESEEEHRAKLPLTLEDLGMVQEEDMDYSYYNTGNFLIRQHDYLQTGLEVTQQKPGNELYYTIYESDFDWIYRQILKENFFENKYVELDYQEIKAVEFNAEKVYYLNFQGELHRYLILIDNKIIDLQTDFLLTQEQRAAVAEKLSIYLH